MAVKTAHARDPVGLRPRYLGNEVLWRTAQPGVQRKDCEGSCGGSCTKCAGRNHDDVSSGGRLPVGAPDDVYEREAESIAGRVMRMPGTPPKGGRPAVWPSIQRLSRASGAVNGTDITLSSAEARPLSAGTRAFMEPRFGEDLSSVRLHKGPRAEESARHLDAHAFTYGRDIWLGKGAEENDRRLMAHELTHVLQQGGVTERAAAEPSSGVSRIQRDRRPPPAAQQCPDGVETVTVDLVSLGGSNRNPVADLQFANNVFRNCCVQFQLSTGVSVVPSLSDTWLGGDTDLQREHSCTDVDPEEEAMRAGATAEFGLGGDIRVFYVASMTPALNGVSFPPFCSSGDRGRFLHHTYISNSANDRTLAHELGHQLLDCECHAQADPDNLLIPNGPGSNLDDGQCATIFSNA